MIDLSFKISEEKEKSALGESSTIYGKSIMKSRCLQIQRTCKTS
ncbi:unnamed protein product (macronuclear) [Paramecium tetraurelia]|uniref:Uncharacterized protein n=1 Tax=Paramecium tetraurelia TaxID=5888 RepID=A0C3R6_PARTE|nr:uncharacterized protein GSPATT00034912001 [Paramecium tetraurelia]CAK65433.1 unnamed protein product [Paramecium tetraurelia]